MFVYHIKGLREAEFHRFLPDKLITGPCTRWNGFPMIFYPCTGKEDEEDEDDVSQRLGSSVR